MANYLVHHVSLVVSDIEESLKFYSILGFLDKFMYSEEDGSVEIHHLKNQNFIVELFRYKNSNKRKVKQNNIEIGVEHFSMQVGDINSAYKELCQKNVNILTPITIGRTGINYFFICDPDGNKIEIVEDGRNLL